MNLQNKLDRQMNQPSVWKLLLSLSVSTTVAMLISSAYAIADAYFVSKIGTIQAASVGVSFSFISLIQAVGFTLGSGSASLCSFLLGKKEMENVKSISAIAIWTTLVFSSVITVLGLTFLKPILSFFGTTKNVFPYAKSYAVWLLLSAPFMCCNFVLGFLLRARGKTGRSMIGLSAAYLLNIALDPLLIFFFDLGIAGASLSTLISQSIGFLLLFFFFYQEAGSSSFSPKIAICGISKIGKMILLGLPSLFRQGFAAVGSILLTRAAANIGNEAVAAVSIVSRLFLILLGFCLGIGQGMMPAVGYHYGAKNLKRVKELYQNALLLSSAILLLLSALFFFFPRFWIGLFRNEESIVLLGSVALRWQAGVSVFHGVITVTTLFLQAVGKKLPAGILAIARQGIFFIPLIFILPKQYGQTGVLFTQGIADICTFLFSLPFLFYSFRFIKKQNLQK